MNSSFLKAGNKVPVSAAAYFCLPYHLQTSKVAATPRSDHRYPDFWAEDSLETLPHYTGLMGSGIPLGEPGAVLALDGMGNLQPFFAGADGSACLVRHFFDSFHLTVEYTDYT